jgi:hypothetical protein
MKAFNLLLDADMRARLDACAATKDMSVGKLIRQIVLAYLNRYAPR